MNNWSSSTSIMCSGIYLNTPNSPIIKYRRVRPDALPPLLPEPGNAGIDLLAQEEITLSRGEPVQMETGVAFEIPYGYAGLILGRSGNAFRSGVFCKHHGLIDSSYRGEVFVLMVSEYETITIQRGQAFAQMIIIPILFPQLQEARVLSATARGENGFGSSGVVGQ